MSISSAHDLTASVFEADVQAARIFISPTIIRGLGFATWRSQLMSTPPYVLAFFVTMGGAYYSHKLKKRGPFIIAFDALTIIGKSACSLYARPTWKLTVIVSYR